MWVSSAVKDWFRISAEQVSDLKSELAALKAENTLLKDSNRTLSIMSDFLRAQVNTLQLERAALMAKAYNIAVPVPELQRAPQHPSLPDFDFSDMGDTEAKAHGLPVYDS